MMDSVSETDVALVRNGDRHENGHWLDNANDTGSVRGNGVAPGQADANPAPAIQIVNAAPVKCRQIRPTDIPAISSLLFKHFPRHSREYFHRALERLGSRAPPAGYPTYGYMLESAGVAVGALLAITFRRNDLSNSAVQCNLSCWCVEGGFRPYASLLLSKVPKFLGSVIINISPHIETWATIEAQGFHRFAEGQFVAVPALSKHSRRTTVTNCTAETTPTAQLALAEQKLLIDHAGYGCISIVCRDGDSYFPFVFRIQYRRFLPPIARLIYCRNLEDLAVCASAFGRFLATQGVFWLIVSTNGPLKGLPGLYLRHKAPMYFKGQQAPRIGDIAYTEAALFGF